MGEEAFTNQVDLFRTFLGLFGSNMSVDEPAVFLKHVLLLVFYKSKVLQRSDEKFDVSLVMYDVSTSRSPTTIKLYKFVI